MSGQFIVTEPLEPHPAALIMPMMSDAQFADFKRSIQENGLNHPIILHEGKILDGRNRYKACLELGVEVRAVTWKVDKSPLDFVLQENMDRRQLTESQRGMVAAKATDLRAKLEAEARERQREAGREHGRGMEKVMITGSEAIELSHPQEKPTGTPTRELIGKQFGISGATVQRSQRVLSHGTPEEIEAVEQGHVTVSAAVRKINERINPKPVQEAKPQPEAQPEEKEVEEKKIEALTPGYGRVAMQMADLAINQLGRIQPNDPNAPTALDKVIKWCKQEKRNRCTAKS